MVVHSVMKLNSKRAQQALVSFCVALEGENVAKCKNPGIWPVNVSLKDFEGQPGWRLIKETHPAPKMVSSLVHAPPVRLPVAAADP